MLAGYWKKWGRFKGGEAFIRFAVALPCFQGFPTGGEIFAWVGSAGFSPISARKVRFLFVFTQCDYSWRRWEICVKPAGFDLRNKHPEKALLKIWALLPGCSWAAAMAAKSRRVVCGGFFAGITGMWGWGWILQFCAGQKLLKVCGCHFAVKNVTDGQIFAEQDFIWACCFSSARPWSNDFDVAFAGGTEKGQKRQISRFPSTSFIGRNLSHLFRPVSPKFVAFIHQHLLRHARSSWLGPWGSGPSHCRTEIWCLRHGNVDAQQFLSHQISVSWWKMKRARQGLKCFRRKLSAVNCSQPRPVGKLILSLFFAIALKAIGNFSWTVRVWQEVCAFLGLFGCDSLQSFTICPPKKFTICSWGNFRWAGDWVAQNASIFRLLWRSFFDVSLCRFVLEGALMVFL